jgi:hypothetical protein
MSLTMYPAWYLRAPMDLPLANFHRSYTYPERLEF